MSIQVAKPPAAWTGIAYVETKAIALGRLRAPTTLFDGSAREGVPHFPQNVHIAAVLALAGIGMDQTASTGIGVNHHRSGKYPLSGESEDVLAGEHPVGVVPKVWRSRFPAQLWDSDPLLGFQVEEKPI